MKLTVTGRVHPERAEVWFNPPVIWENEGGRVVVRCESSQLKVLVDVDFVDDSVIGYLVAQHLAQSSLSALGFAHGTGYSVELIQLLPEGGEPTVFGVRIPGLMFDVPNDVFRSAVELSRKDVHLRMALRDYTAAMANPIDCAHLCYRAIEAVKSSFGPGSDGECWRRMHAILGTTRDDIDSVIKPYADPIRHGNWAGFPKNTATQRQAMYELTRNLISRYMRIKPATGTVAPRED